MANDGAQGAAGAGSGGEDKGGAGAGGQGAGGAQSGGAQGGAGGQGGSQGQQGGQGAAGGAGDDSRSLAGGAGLPKGDDKGGKGDGGKGGDDAAKLEADKQARAALEKEFAKDLDGKSDAEKKAFLDKKMAERAGQGKDGKQDGAPAEYTDFSLPEGMEIDAEAMTEFKAIARDLNLSQEKAQKLVSLQAKIEKTRADAALAEFDKTWKSWRQETVTALGSNLDTEQANVGRFIEQFGSPELRKLMDATRVGENIHLFKAMAAAGAKLAEGKLPEGAGAGAGKEAPEKRWFPKMREQMASSGQK